MGSRTQNRPFKFTDGNRSINVVQDSEIGVVAINDTNGNPIFLGRVLVGRPLTSPLWQIRKIQYDSNQGVTRVQWPQIGNIGSSDFRYIWSSVSELTITGITRANSAVITVSDLRTLVNGNKIVIQSVAGMTEVNLDGPASNIFTVVNINAIAKTFELSGIDSTAYTAYTSGGTVSYGEVINYTYV